MTLAGGCHCGAVRYQLEWPADQPIPARRCTCTYCTRFGGTWTSHPEARLAFECTASSVLGRYRFGTGTADFCFCNSCGVMVAALDDHGGRLKAVVNVRTLDEFDSLAFEHADSCFDGEATDDRLQRRGRNWIPRVSFAQG
ncbi:MAG: hypothetical protein R3348_05710 [Xanthomonadales bacterium]|nr:hypothetical protein [Xanthomonadales bacterium]